MTITQKQIDRSLAQKAIDIITRIRELSKKNSINQTELAEKAGMQKQALSKILSYPPVQNITLETLVKLELALKGDILESRNFYEDELISNPEIAIALNRAILISDLPEEDKKKYHSELSDLVIHFQDISAYQEILDKWEPLAKLKDGELLPIIGSLA